MVSKDTGEFVGMLGLNAMIPAAELAYHLHPAHWGHGFATEACVCVLAWLMRHYPGKPAEVFIERDNGASLALARRLGFRFTGATKDGALRFLRESA